MDCRVTPLRGGPGMTSERAWRPSSRSIIFAKTMDARVKPAHDGGV
jgi:hypothetical protein